MNYWEDEGAAELAERICGHGSVLTADAIKAVVADAFERCDEIDSYGDLDVLIVSQAVVSHLYRNGALIGAPLHRTCMDLNMENPQQNRSAPKDES